MTVEPKVLVDLQTAGAETWGLHLFEEIIRSIYRKTLKHGDSVVDGGANAGLHTLPLAKAVGPGGRVLAFEPIPALARSLRGLLDREGLKHVQVRQEALSNRQGRARFHWLRNRPAESSLSPSNMDPDKDDVESFDVDTVRLDDILPGVLQAWRFAKLDLEGAEFDALRGAAHSLKTHRPMVILEFGYHAAAKSGGYDQAEWDAFFDAIGYRLYDLAGRPLLHRPWGDLQSHIWYLIAVPGDSPDESFVLNGLPHEVAPLRDEWAKAFDEGRRPKIDDLPQ